MDKELFHLLNTQLEKELYSANLYLAMAGWAQGQGYNGAAHWMYVQYQEETAHAIHLWQYLLGRGAAVSIAAIEQPENSWPSLSAMFSQVQTHEKTVSGLINAIASCAQDKRDHACYQFILWYVGEQVEEEATAATWLGKLRLAEGQAAALLALDGELATRVYNPPFPSLGL